MSRAAPADGAARLRRVVSRVLGVPVEDVRDESTPDAFKSWDSLAHIHLVLAIEREFGVALSPEEALEMLSVKRMRQILEGKGAA